MDEGMKWDEIEWRDEMCWKLEEFAFSQVHKNVSKWYLWNNRHRCSGYNS